MVILKSKTKNFTNIKDQKYRYKNLKNIDINKILVPNKGSFVKKGSKYFIDYKDAKKIRTLCIFFSKMSAYRGDFGETKYMSFLIKGNELLEKYN